jgi:hypothetical protein
MHQLLPIVEQVFFDNVLFQDDAQGALPVAIEKTDGEESAVFRLRSAPGRRVDRRYRRMRLRQPPLHR